MRGTSSLAVPVLSSGPQRPCTGTETTTSPLRPHGPSEWTSAPARLQSKSSVPQSDHLLEHRTWKYSGQVTSTHCKVSARHFLTLSRPPLSAGTSPFCGCLRGAHTQRQKMSSDLTWSDQVVLPSETTGTCVKVHLSDLVMKRQKRVWVGQVHWQRKGKQSDENKKYSRVLQHCKKKKKKTAKNPWKKYIFLKRYFDLTL